MMTIVDRKERNGEIEYVWKYTILIYLFRNLY